MFGRGFWFWVWGFWVIAVCALGFGYFTLIFVFVLCLCRLLRLMWWVLRFGVGWLFEYYGGVTCECLRFLGSFVMYLVCMVVCYNVI